MRRFSFLLLPKWSMLIYLNMLMSSSMALGQSLPPAIEIASQIEIGWNIGNSLEAIGGETNWGNPRINQQLIDGVKAAGFNALRIPCAWDIYANQETLAIDPAWLARVKEVVNYAMNADMYVVLNIHWDGGWLEEHPFYADQEAVNKKQRAYWTQIANNFKNYDERLLFAGTNEVHADYGTPTTEHITVQESYNQTFVDAVRATGGNNATRTLVVQTYNTNMWHGLDYFTMPTDTVSDRLIVEVHNYDPYDYTLNPSGACLYWGSSFPSQSTCSWAQEAYFDDLFARIRAKWVDRGIPVIIGEYGVATRPNLDLNSREYYLAYFNGVAAINGIKTFYWDNGVAPTQSNGFAIFDRNTGAVMDQDTLDAVMSGVNPSDRHTLTVTKDGSGSGVVSSSPAGVECGTTCSASFSSSTSITLTATADANSSFVSWDGACSGSGPCTVSMLSDKRVTAIFITGTSFCENPITFSGSTGNFNTTEAVCYRTSDTINGWGCYNFDGRTIRVGGLVRECGEMPLIRANDGYIYFTATAGIYPWAGIYTY